MEYFQKLFFILFIVLFLLPPSSPILAAIDVEVTAEVLPQEGVLPPVIDTKAPIILKVEIRAITLDSAVIYWETDEFSTSVVDYGLTFNYELGTVVDKTNSLFTAHQLILSGLKPGTMYHFRIRSADNSGNQAVSGDFTFTTLKLPDKISPANVRNFKAEARGREIFLSWLNPDDSDFTEVRIERSEKKYILNPGEGFLIYRGKDESYLDKNLVNEKRYYYTIWAVDEAGNFSSGALVSAVPRAPAPPPFPPEEIIPEIAPGVPAVGLPLTIPAVPIVPKERIVPEDISFFIDYDLIKIQPLKGVLQVFPDASLTFSIPLEKFSQPVKMIQVLIEGRAYLLRLNEEKKVYEGMIKLSEFQGEYPLIMVIIYEDGRAEVVASKVLIESRGKIRSTKDKDSISEAKITLYYYDEEKKEWKVWNGDKYNQKNPQITNEKGEYNYTVQPGKYYLIVVKEGYLTKKTEEFEVRGNIVNFEIDLIPLEVIKYWVWPGVGALAFLILLAIVIFSRLLGQIIRIFDLGGFSNLLIGLLGGSLKEKGKKGELRKIREKKEEEEMEEKEKEKEETFQVFGAEEKEEGGFAEWSRKHREESNGQ